MSSSWLLSKFHWHRNIFSSEVIQKIPLYDFHKTLLSKTEFPILNFRSIAVPSRRRRCRRHRRRCRHPRRRLSLGGDDHFCDCCQCLVILTIVCCCRCCQLLFISLPIYTWIPRDKIKRKKSSKKKNFLPSFSLFSFSSFFLFLLSLFFLHSFEFIEIHSLIHDCDEVLRGRISLESESRFTNSRVFFISSSLSLSVLRSRDKLVRNGIFVVFQPLSLSGKKLFRNGSHC